MWLVGASLTLGPVAASPHEYRNFLGEGDLYVLCVHDELAFDIGGVCIPPGHLLPNALGQVTLTINDLVNNPTSGFYCQDQDGDQICGETNQAVAQSAAADQEVPLVPVELRGQTVCAKLNPLCDIDENQSHFCASVTITSGIDWDENLDVFVFIDGPIWGNPVNSPCGNLSNGVQGEVVH